MKIVTVKFTDEEYKAMEAEIVEGPETWTIHAGKNRARQAMDSIIERETTHRAKALDLAEKEAIIRPIELESAKARNDRKLAEMEAKFNKPIAPTGRT